MSKPTRPTLPITQACAALLTPRSSVYQTHKNLTRPARTPWVKPPSARALSHIERTQILDLMNSPRFVDLPPRQIYASLLDEGRFLGSISTLYRVLRSADQSHERRAQRTLPKRVKPELVASAPLQVCTWDITYMRGPVRGSFFYAYVMIDLFSRYIVGWLVCDTESAQQAQLLIAQTCARYGIPPDTLTLHADNGAPMKALGVQALLHRLGVAESHSRPHTSNDNPYSEAGFKTMKYRPDYPKFFLTQTAATDWMRAFVQWFNHEHHHSALALMTPAQVFAGNATLLQAQRQTVLDAAFASHPQRFVAHPPIARLPPPHVFINPSIPIRQPIVSTLNS